MTWKSYVICSNLMKHIHVTYVYIYRQFPTGSHPRSHQDATARLKGSNLRANASPTRLFVLR